MLTRLQSNSEISILPTGLGNHYASRNHLVPPGRQNVNYSQRPSIFSRSSIDNNTDDPDAPEANISFRSQNEYFGPDVLVILGIVLASGGAILTLVSLYCTFKHPAIQATIAGIGPSLIGIGMLFCVLRLFFCSFFTTRTCCECFADGVKYLTQRLPCCRSFQQRLPGKKRVQPTRVRPTVASQPPKSVANGELRQSMQKTADVKKPTGADEKPNLNHQVKYSKHRTSSQSVEVVAITLPKRDSSKSYNDSPRDEPRIQKDESSLAIGKEKELSENLINDGDDFDENYELPRQDEEDILKDEIANLDQRLSSAHSAKVQNRSINELVLNHSKT